MRNLYVILLLLISMNISAQCRLDGHVYGENHSPLPYATVRVLSNDSVFVKGTTADSLGCYSLNALAAERYIVTYSCLGYSASFVTVDFRNQSQQRVNVDLQPDQTRLREVEIVGSSFVRTEDGLIAIPNKQQIKHASTGYDLLYNLMIPGVDVDRRSGKVSAFNQRVTLYIDGQKADYREVQSLRPRDIVKVEYYDAPTGRYSGDVTSINYVTRQYKAGGYVTLDAEQTIGYLNGNYNAVAKLVHGGTSYTLFAGHKMNESEGNRVQKEEHIYFPDDEVVRDYETMEARAKSNTQYAQLNIQNKTDRRTLVSKVAFVRNDVPENYNVSRLQYNGLQQTSRRQTQEKGWMPSLNFYGNFELASNQYVEASLGGSYSDNTYGYVYREDDGSVSTTTDENMYELNANVNYGIRLKHKNSLTVKLYHLHKVSMSDYHSTNDLWQHLWTGETILFSEYNHRIGKKTSLRVSPGASLLQYKLHGDDMIRQFSPRLQLVLTHQPSPKQYIQLRANVGNSFPTISMLNNVEQNVDLIQVQRGNSSLETTKAYYLMGVYALHSGKFSLQATGMYQFYNDMYVSDRFIEGHNLIQTYRSDVNWQQVIGMLSLTWKPMTNLQVKLDGNYNYSKFTRGVSAHQQTLSGSLQLNYYWRDFMFNVYGKTPSRMMDLSMTRVWMPASYGAVVSWSHKDWRMEAGVSNPFYNARCYRFTLDDDAYSLRSSSTSKADRMTGYVKVAYTFDFLKKVKHDAKQDVDTKINSAILKVE